MDLINTYVTKINTWGAQAWWKGLLVHLGGAILGMLVTVYGVKYLPAPVVSEITTAIANVQVVNATPINPAP